MKNRYSQLGNFRENPATVTVAASLKGTYTYNAREQISIRVTSNMTPRRAARKVDAGFRASRTPKRKSGTTHFIHDLNGNPGFRRGRLLAETAGNGPTGATGTVREYIYLPETEIAPAADGRTRVDRPLAVVNAVNTVTPATYYVHVDHLNRPVMMTDGAKAQVWAAVWQSWGGSYSITGPQANDARFPGQWFQLESGLHYNWHRHYDPSIGRYTQPDPLGFVDGLSVYGYAKGMPQSAVDPDGRQVGLICAPAGPLGVAACSVGIPIIIRAAVRQCLKAAANDNGKDPDPDKYCKLANGSGQSLPGGNAQCLYKCKDGSSFVDRQQSAEVGCRLYANRPRGG